MLMRFTRDYQKLIVAGDLLHALGAGLELVDVALRVAATPASNILERRYKAGFFAEHFPSMMQSFGQGHIALIADAAIEAEKDLAADHRRMSRDNAARRSYPVDGGSMSEADDATVPEGRLALYEVAAGTMGNIQGTITTARQISVDRATLQREGRVDAMIGADNLLAGVIRRMCVTKASSRYDARAKFTTLTAVQRLYHGGNGESYLLMGAMIDATMALEAEEWPNLTALP